MPLTPPVEVIAGVITDAGGRVLLARRTEGRDLAGLWEFPGGKREPGETPEAALARELAEELGIHVDVGERLIEVPQAYPHKRLRLDVRHVRSWRGTPRGHEGQALAWVPPDKLVGYAMPPADRPVVAALLQPDRYLVTPACDGDEEGWLQALRRSLPPRPGAGGGGAQGRALVQLRSPGADPARWRALCSRALEACRTADATVLVNGDIELARELGVGVHLPARMLAGLGRRPLPGDVPVAASCHTLEELQAAEAAGCDFAVLGPLAETSSHPGASVLGWEGFAALREHASLPIYAIGGLSPADIIEARRHGAQGIASIRALWHGPSL